MDDNTAITPTGKLYTVATLVGSSVVSAFFTSLERCSCINLTTSDLDDEDEEGLNRGLMFATSTRHDDPRHSLPPPLLAPPAPSLDSLPV